MLTKEEQIEHWKNIVLAVFRAEDSLPKIWESRLRVAKSVKKEMRERICDSYVKAIATEIVDNCGMEFADE